MIFAKSHLDLHNIRNNVERVKKLSDNVVGIGPLGVGLDGLLTWIPIVGTVYSVGAAGWLLTQAMRAKATPGTIARMVGYLGVDVATGEVPIAGDVVDFFFPGHLMAAKALQKDIESTHWVEARERDAKASGDHDRHVQDMRSQSKRRIVYLHD